MFSDFEIVFNEQRTLKYVESQILQVVLITQCSLESSTFDLCSSLLLVSQSMMAKNGDLFLSTTSFEQIANFSKLRVPLRISTQKQCSSLEWMPSIKETGSPYY